MIYDLIIIGGGMSGISVGHHFRNRHILILERNSLLSGASGNNAGFIISGFGEHYFRTAERWGRDRAIEIQNIHLKSHARIRDLAKSADCDYMPSGSLSIGIDAQEEDILVKSFEMMQKDRFQVEWVRNTRSGLLDSKAGLLNRLDASIDSPKFWSFLAQDLPAVLNCNVEHVESGDPCRIITSCGTFSACKVVFCLNAFSAALIPELDGRFFPLRGQIVEIPVVPAPPTHMPVITQYGDVYWRFTKNKLIFGGLEYLFPDLETGIVSEISEKILNAQLQWIHEHFDPHLFQGKPTASGSRSGTMAFTIDGFPFVGELRQKNFYVLAGLCGLGHGYSLECAYWLFELIEKERMTIPGYCSSDRIDSLPVHRGGNWRNYEAWNH